MMNILTATGRFLDALAVSTDLHVKSVRVPFVNCTCYGLKGTVIPYGAIVEGCERQSVPHERSQRHKL